MKSGTNAQETVGWLALRAALAPLGRPAAVVALAIREEFGVHELPAGD